MSRPGLPASSVGGGCRAGRSSSGVGCVGGPGPPGDVLVPVWSSNQPSESITIWPQWPGLRKRGAEPRASVRLVPGPAPTSPGPGFRRHPRGSGGGGQSAGRDWAGPGEESDEPERVELPWAGWVCKERKHRSLPASPQIFRSSKDPFAVAIGT